MKSMIGLTGGEIEMLLEGLDLLIDFNEDKLDKLMGRTQQLLEEIQQLEEDMQKD